MTLEGDSSAVTLQGLCNKPLIITNYASKSSHY
jgi:hypothetical protein